MVPLRNESGVASLSSLKTAFGSLLKGSYRGEDLFERAFVTVTLKDPNDAKVYQAFCKNREISGLDVTAHVRRIYCKIIIPTFMEQYQKALNLEFPRIVDDVERGYSQYILDILLSRKQESITKCFLPSPKKVSSIDGRLQLEKCIDADLLSRIRACYISCLRDLELEYNDRIRTLGLMIDYYHKQVKIARTNEKEEKKVSLKQLYEQYTFFYQRSLQYETLITLDENELLYAMNRHAKMDLPQGGPFWKPIAESWVQQTYKVLFDLYILSKKIEKPFDFKKLNVLFAKKQIAAFRRQVIMCFSNRIQKILATGKSFKGEIDTLRAEVRLMNKDLNGALHTLLQEKLQAIEKQKADVKKNLLAMKDLDKLVMQRDELLDLIHLEETNILDVQIKIIDDIGKASSDIEQKSDAWIAMCEKISNIKVREDILALYTITTVFSTVTCNLSQCRQNKIQKNFLARFNKYYDKHKDKISSKELLRLVDRFSSVFNALNGVSFTHIEEMEKKVFAINDQLAKNGVEIGDGFEHMIERYKKTSPKNSPLLKG